MDETILEIGTAAGTSQPDGLQATRRRITVLLDEILKTGRQLWAQGIDPTQKEDVREAKDIVRRITERSYQGQ